MNTPPGQYDRWHTCGAPGCTRRLKTWYFACGQHRQILGYDLNVRLQTAWHERRWDPTRFESTRLEAFKAWGWTPEPSACLTP